MEESKNFTLDKGIQNQIESIITNNLNNKEFSGQFTIADPNDKEQQYQVIHIKNQIDSVYDSFFQELQEIYNNNYFIKPSNIFQLEFKENNYIVLQYILSDQIDFFQSLDKQSEENLNYLIDGCLTQFKKIQQHQNIKICSSEELFQQKLIEGIFLKLVPDINVFKNYYLYREEINEENIIFMLKIIERYFLKNSEYFKIERQFIDQLLKENSIIMNIDSISMYFKMMRKFKQQYKHTLNTNLVFINYHFVIYEVQVGSIKNSELIVMKFSDCYQQDNQKDQYKIQFIDGEKIANLSEVQIGEDLKIIKLEKYKNYDNIIIKLLRQYQENNGSNQSLLNQLWQYGLKSGTFLIQQNIDQQCQMCTKCLARYHKNSQIIEQGNQRIQQFIKKKFQKFEDSGKSYKEILLDLEQKQFQHQIVKEYLDQSDYLIYKIGQDIIVEITTKDQQYANLKNQVNNEQFLNQQDKTIKDNQQAAQSIFLILKLIIYLNKKNVIIYNFFEDYILFNDSRIYFFYQLPQQSQNSLQKKQQQSQSIYDSIISDSKKTNEQKNYQIFGCYLLKLLGEDDLTIKNELQMNSFDQKNFKYFDSIKETILIYLIYQQQTNLQLFLQEMNKKLQELTINTIKYNLEEIEGQCQYQRFYIGDISLGNQQNKNRLKENKSIDFIQQVTKSQNYQNEIKLNMSLQEIDKGNNSKLCEQKLREDQFTISNNQNKIFQIPLLNNWNICNKYQDTDIFNKNDNLSDKFQENFNSQEQTSSRDKFTYVNKPYQIYEELNKRNDIDETKQLNNQQLKNSDHLKNNDSLEQTQTITSLQQQSSISNEQAQTLTPIDSAKENHNFDFDSQKIQNSQQEEQTKSLSNNKNNFDQINQKESNCSQNDNYQNEIQEIKLNFNDKKYGESEIQSEIQKICQRQFSILKIEMGDQGYRDSSLQYIQEFLKNQNHLLYFSINLENSELTQEGFSNLLQSFNPRLQILSIDISQIRLIEFSSVFMKILLSIKKLKELASLKLYMEKIQQISDFSDKSNFDAYESYEYNSSIKNLTLELDNQKCEGQFMANNVSSFLKKFKGLQKLTLSLVNQGMNDDQFENIIKSFMNVESQIQFLILIFNYSDKITEKSLEKIKQNLDKMKKLEILRIIILNKDFNNHDNLFEKLNYFNNPNFKVYQ
ncbi:hypothetical protein TTHERM_00577310 (macronuclear) [Tetrahymena thermophila SB210]|uniref:Uncharacterized protein n=1 Tax=Tetrahymena thermophila (strain SB210) TaxID=312017 RepID=Q22UX2_TETTS|nr:hypothetical protein TTHERM_00577310 [Tetrahymena thermophila SB210]EAR89176.2 hypothetical protein TTHERM_00577310 [Tetrahymena thermophila SB210]|eukprot:XP_001009421.2 hypothetical protein TTHERM_00577310 [Tetrahymena thermophila SB210]